LRLSERVEREEAGGSGQAPPGNGERTMRRLRTTEHPRKALRTGTLILLIVAGLQASCSDDQSPRQDHPNPPDLPAVGRPLFRDEFTEVAPQGFGDRQNTKAWSMKWWKDQLHVGTARAHTCVQDASLAFRIGGIFQYPREDPDLECTESPQDLPLQAEIWNLSPATEVWERVYQSPQDLEIPDHPGKVVARDIGLRGMVLFGNPEDGTEELYVGGVSSELINPDIGPPRMLHSEDGIHFEPIPQDPGTVMGDLGFKQGNMRSMATVDGRLFVVIGESRGDGDLYEATDPAGGNNNFRIVSPPRMKIYEMCLYNGTLYLGLTQDESKEGYFVVKTDARGDLPYKFTVVVPNGGYLTPYPSNTVVSMCVFQDRLYVGTDKPAELIRINPDDTWDLLVGAARETPEGWKEPLSGMTAGFNWALNEHIWQMAVHEGWLYIGTNDLTSLNMKNWRLMDLPVIGPLLQNFQGYDLVATRDGVHYTIIDRAGFGDGLEVGFSSGRPTPTTAYGSGGATPIGLPTNRILPRHSRWRQKRGPPCCAGMMWVVPNGFTCSALRASILLKKSALPRSFAFGTTLCRPLTTPITSLQKLWTGRFHGLPTPVLSPLGWRRKPSQGCTSSSLATNRRESMHQPVRKPGFWAVSAPHRKALTRGERRMQRPCCWGSRQRRTSTRAL
jgi:hypothetical protein